MSSPWKSLGVTIHDPGTRRQGTVPAPCGGKDDATLGKRAGTSSCHRDPEATTWPLGSPFPCRAQAWGAERELRGFRGENQSPWPTVGTAVQLRVSAEGQLLPGPAGLAAWQDRTRVKPSLTSLAQNC